MKKVKILFTIPNFTTAGSGREMVNIIYRLDKNLFDVTVAVESPGGTLYDELLQNGHKVLVMPLFVTGTTSIPGIFKEARKQAKHFRHYRFDIWQSFNWSSDFSEALIAKFSGAYYVYVKKNMNWDRAAWKVKSFLSKAIIARNITLLLTVLFPPYLRRKTHYVGGGVDTDKFIFTGNRSFREQYDIPYTAFVVTCIAQLVRVKDQVTLIKAAAQIEKAYLILAGAEKDEAYGKELHDLVDELKMNGRVTFAGPVSAVNDLLNTSDAYVLPTTNMGGHEEGSPVSLLEAMAAQVPCVASNVAGSRDLIRTNDTGLLFQPGNIEELTACIRKYMDDKGFAETMAQNARTLVVNEHTLEKEAAAFQDVYKKIMRIKTS